jgi:tripeptidyl-peptidase-1
MVSLRSLFSLVLVRGSVAGRENQVVTYFLKQGGAEQILVEALAVSDPRSERYGDFLSFERVLELQQPATGSLERVHAHLDAIGALDRRVSQAGDKVVAVVPKAVRLSAHEVPQELQDVLDGVLTPSDEFVFQPPKRRIRPMANASHRAAADDASACLSPLTGVTPTCLRKAYGVGDMHASHPDNLQALIVNQEFLPSDLAAFLSKYNLPSQDVVKYVDGTPTKAETEASLDVQYITALGSGTPTWWQFLDDSSDNPFASWLTYMADAPKPPLVQSLSLGAPETAVGSQLVQRMNTELAALGARGVTIVFASGDSGYTPAQKFGACSPFVTAVGGVWRGEMGDSPFQSVDEISTGGFSSLEVNAAPDWQKAAVAAYLKTSGARPAGAVDATRRCVPDFSMFDDGLQVTQNGGEGGEGGTSCSAPVASGIFSQINDQLLKAGHSPLGFVNPLLYANQAAFLDITHGMNGILKGFEAVEGYDPASGLGTFDDQTLGKLLAAAKAAKSAARAKRLNQVLV